MAQIYGFVQASGPRDTNVVNVSPVSAYVIPVATKTCVLNQVNRFYQ